MNALKIAFFGTSDRSVEILDVLKKNFSLVLCVTKSDVTFGRRREVKETEVKNWAKKNAVNYITIETLKGIELDQVSEQLTYSNVDYIVVADFSIIIPELILNTFPGRVISIHFSLLPKYRGASPVQASILNGDDNTGITYHLVDRKMDTGAIIHQIGYNMSHNETSGELYDTLFHIAARELPEIILKYHNREISLRPQNEEIASYTRSPSHPDSTFIYKEDARIDWKESTQQIERKIRAFNPWPVAWTYLNTLENNKKLKNSKLAFRDNPDKSKKVKIYKASLDENNLLEIKELQIEGKKKSLWEEFANGYIKK